jgi:hypothetical protein
VNGNSFFWIVRFWADESTEPATWRGAAERFGSQRPCAFQTLGKFMDWMQQELVQNDWFVEGGRMSM